MSQHSCARSFLSSVALGSLALLSLSCGGGSGEKKDEGPVASGSQPSGTLVLMGDDVPMVPEEITVGDLVIADQGGFATQYFFVDEDSLIFQNGTGPGGFEWVPGDVNNLFTLLCTEVLDGVIDNLSFTIVVGGVSYIFTCDEDGDPGLACGLITVDSERREMVFDNVTLHADSGAATGSLLVNGVLSW